MNEQLIQGRETNLVTYYVRNSSFISGDGDDSGGLILAPEDFGGRLSNQSPPELLLFFFFNGDQFSHTNCTLARVSPLWRRLWAGVRLCVACELCPCEVVTLCPDSIDSPLRFRRPKGISCG